MPRLWKDVKRELAEGKLNAGDGFVCPFGCQRAVGVLHHIIPRSRTSKKHPATWLQDSRNLLWTCFECHYSGVEIEGHETVHLHTVAGIKLCIEKQQQMHPEWDYDDLPWRPYLE